jgi:hypothetical protein
MGLFSGSGRKNTGRTDKYSDESPKKDYDDYRKDYPNDNKQPRKDAKDITDGKIKPKHLGKKSIEVRKQELTSHIQNFRETFNSAELNVWENKLNQLKSALLE